MFGRIASGIGRRSMPDKLRFPKAPAWGDRGPRTETLKQDIARWYEPAGGIDAAISRAERAMRESPNDPLFPDYSTGNLNARIRVQVEDLPPGKRGYFDPYQPMVHLDDRYLAEPTSRQNVLEHERSHGVFGAGNWGKAYAKEEPVATGKYSKSQGMPQSFTDYITTPPEVDVRLAAIKRMYAYNTGRIVDSPEEAERAIKWYGQNYDQLPKDTPDSPGGRKPYDAGEYLTLPDEMRARVLQRMTEVVRNPIDDLIERLG